jgi:hypothetical protein
MQQGEEDNQSFGEEAHIAPSPSAQSWMETLAEDEGKFLNHRANTAASFSESCLIVTID